MKLFAAILAALTLYLSAQEPVLTARMPAPDDNSCSAEMNCSFVSGSCRKEKNDPKEKKGGCCELLFCNPFGVCCVYLPVERTLLTRTGFFIQTKKSVPVNETALSTYIKDVWHPPETGLFI